MECQRGKGLRLGDSVRFPGENSPEARARICEALEFLGITLEQGRNQSNEPIISAGDARTLVRVIRTDEESMIAQTVCRVLKFSMTHEND